MKSRPIGIQSILATDHNTRRDDARGGSFLLAHEQLGALAFPTNPTNGQTATLTINGTAIVLTYVTAIGTTPNNILIQSTAALTAAATVNFLRRPDITNANQVAAIVGNQALLVYLGWALPSGATTITPFSLNKVVNGASANLTSFTASTTVTGGSWTAQAMQLYVEDGTYYIGATQVKFLGGSSPTVTAPVSHPRIDVLTIDTSGTLAWTTGTENASPTVPTYPAGKVPICELYNVVGETALYDLENQQSGEGYIQADVRPFSSIQSGGYSPIANGVGTASSSTTQTIAHGLGRIPVSLDVVASVATSTSIFANSIGNYNGTQMVCNDLTNNTSSSNIVSVVNSLHQAVATVTWDATNFYLVWTFTGAPGTVNYLWKIM